MREECRAQARTRTGAPPTDMGSRQADRKRRSRASVQVVPPRARRGLVADNSPYRSPRSPATKRFQPASNTDTGDSVQVVKDRRVELRAVTVGVTNRGFTEARTALAAGEIVIARAAAFLRNGDEVRFGVRVSTPW